MAEIFLVNVAKGSEIMTQNKRMEMATRTVGNENLPIVLWSLC